MQLNPNNYGIIENQNISSNKHRSQPFIKQSNDKLLHNKDTLGQFKSLEPDANDTPGQLSLKLDGTQNVEHSDDHSRNMMDSGRELKKGDDSDSDYEEEEHKHHNRF